jgi:hypothetical protein
MIRSGHVERVVGAMAEAWRCYVELLGAEVIAEQGEGPFLWLRFGDGGPDRPL